MEKTWDDFWATGKVTDYLAYCSCKETDKREEQKGHQSDGRVDNSNRNGSNFHAGR